MHGRITFVYNIILDDVILPAADMKRSVGNPIEDVSIDMRSACVVIEVDAPYTTRCLVLQITKIGTTAGESVSVNIVKTVVPDDVTALGPIPSHVERTSVLSFLTYVVNLVVLDHMLVAMKQNRSVRRVMNDIVRNTVADAVDIHADQIAFTQHGKMMDVAVLHDVVRRCQRRTVSTGKHDSTSARLTDIAPHDAITRSAVDPHRVFTDIRNRRRRDRVSVAGHHHDSRFARMLES